MNPNDAPWLNDMGQSGSVPQKIATSDLDPTFRPSEHAAAACMAGAIIGAAVVSVVWGLMTVIAWL